MKRQKMKKSKSRKQFGKYASVTHKRNNQLGSPMRGGIRL